MEQPTSFSHMAQKPNECPTTSHSETLAAISGLETATLVSLRLAELLMAEKKPTLQQHGCLARKGHSVPPNRPLHRLQRLLVIDSWNNPHFLKIEVNESTSWPSARRESKEEFDGSS